MKSEGVNMRVVRASLFLLALHASACAGNDGNGGDGDGSGGTSGDGPTFCDIEPILQDKCHRCHTDPPENDAPFPLVTYDDVDERVARVRVAVDSGFMPLTTASLEPPVEDLSPSERELIVEWIDSGAPAGDCD